MAAGRGGLLRGTNGFLLYSSNVTAGVPLYLLKLFFSSPSLRSPSGPFSICHSYSSTNANSGIQRVVQIPVPARSRWGCTCPRPAGVTGSEGQRFCPSLHEPGRPCAVCTTHRLCPGEISGFHGCLTHSVSVCARVSTRVCTSTCVVSRFCLSRDPPRWGAPAIEIYWEGPDLTLRILKVRSQRISAICHHPNQATSCSG